MSEKIDYSKGVYDARQLGAGRMFILKSECKSTNYFSFHQIFSQKSFILAKYLTVINT